MYPGADKPCTLLPRHSRESGNPRTLRRLGLRSIDAIQLETLPQLEAVSCVSMGSQISEEPT
jgi:hypothetical protein